MKTRSVLCVLAVGCAVSLVAAAGTPAAAGTSVSPYVEVGPRAVQARVAAPNYLLFTCQVGQLPGIVCYDPYQVRHAYGIDTLINANLDGAGKTIVIIDAFSDPYLVGDFNTFINFYGLPSMNGLGGPYDPSLGTFTVVTPDGPPPVDLGWGEEITLDVEWSHAIAPGANITLVEAKSNSDEDILSALKYAVDNNLGDVISQSYGENESCLDPALQEQWHEVFAEATAKGMTIFASSGDNGDAQGSCTGATAVKAVSSPASDPLVTAVGGTELHAADYCLTVLGCDPTANPPAGTYLGEIVWNETGIGGGATGGGFSVVFDEPSYQQGTIHGGKQLGVPDVSYSAAVYHGVLVYLYGAIGGGWYLFGGTSAGSPQWAAITAIADQKAGYSLGFINTALYHIGQARSHYAASFFDVTSGDNSAYGIPGFVAGPGWDATTGLGSPRADQLVDQLIQNVSPGQGMAAIAGSKPHANGKSHAPGQVTPH
jgi:subtilase family serine protease